MPKLFIVLLPGKRRSIQRAYDYTHRLRPKTSTARSQQVVHTCLCALYTNTPNTGTTTTTFRPTTPPPNRSWTGSRIPDAAPRRSASPPSSSSSSSWAGTGSSRSRAPAWCSGARAHPAAARRAPGPAWRGRPARGRGVSGPREPRGVCHGRELEQLLAGERQEDLVDPRDVLEDEEQQLVG